MSAQRVFAVSVLLALLVNAVVAVGAAVAAIDTARADAAPADLIVSGARALTPADFGAVAQQLAGSTFLGPVVSGLELLSTGSARVQAQVQGVSTNFPQVTGWQTAEGRFLTGEDDASLDRVAVIDRTLAQELFPNGDAVGATLRVGEIPFTVVGVGSDPQDDRVLLVPFRTAQIRLFGRGALSAIVLRLNSPGDASSLTRQTEALLRARHNLRPGQPDDFSVRMASIDSRVDNAITGTRVLQVIQQFVCPAKNTCPRNAVSATQLIGV